MPLFPVLDLFVDHKRRVFEDMLKDWFVLLEDDSRHIEVTFQVVNLLSHFGRQVGHIGPLLHFTEELNQTIDREVEQILRKERIGCERNRP